MKRFCLIALLALPVFGCSKLEEHAQHAQSGTKLCISASIDAVKSGYNQDGKVLRYTWEVGDSISVVSLSGGNVATVDLFKATSGGSTAVFVGEYTGSLNNTVLCIYPALSENNGSEWYSKSRCGQTGFYNITTGKSTVIFAQKRLLDFIQTADGDASHILGTDLMMGQATLGPTGGRVIMTKRTSVIKVEATIPELTPSEKIKTLDLSITNAYPFTNYGATLALNAAAGTNWTTSFPVSSLTLGFGGTQNGMFSGISVSGNKLTAYVPLIPNTNYKSLQGSSARTLNVKVNTDKNVYSKDITIPATSGSGTYTLSGGYIHNVNATLAKTGTALGNPIEEVSQFQTESANAMYLDGNYLYVGGGQIRIYDVSNPGSPALVGTAPVLGGVRQIVVQGDWLYTSNRETGAYVYNISDRANPYMVCRYDCLELATGIDVCGNVLFISHRDNGVEFVDVTDPTKPTHITQFKTNESQSIFYKDGVLYSGEWSGGQVTVFDASDMSNVTKATAVNLQGFGDGVWAQGNRLYASTGHNHRNSAPYQYSGDGHGMEIWDISNKLAPKFISRVEFDTFYKTGSDWWFARPNADGTMIYCTDVYNGFYVVDARDEAHPKIVARWRIDSDHAINSLAVGDGYVYLAYGTYGGYMIKAPQATKAIRDKGTAPANASYRDAYETPAASNFYSWQPTKRGSVHSAAVYGDALIVACGDAGLYVVKQNPDGTLYQDSCVSDQYAGDVTIRGDQLYVARGEVGVDIYTVTSGPTLTKKKTLKSELGDSSMQFSFWVNAPNDKYLVSAPRSKGYSMIAIGGWSSFKTYTYRGQKSSSVNYNKFIADQVCGNDLLPYMSRTGLLWIDLSNTSSFSVSSPTSIKGGTSTGVTHFRDGSALYGLDSRIYTVAAGGTSGTAHGSTNSLYSGVPRWDGENKVMFCNTNSKKLALVDVTNINSPSVIFSETTNGRPEAANFWNGKAVVPCGFQGLLVEK